MSTSRTTSFVPNQVLAIVTQNGLFQVPDSSDDVLDLVYIYHEEYRSSLPRRLPQFYLRSHEEGG